MPCEIRNLPRNPEISEIFAEIREILTEIPKSREISSEITKSLLKSQNLCIMSGEVGVFLFLRMHTYSLFEVSEGTWHNVLCACKNMGTMTWTQGV